MRKHYDFSKMKGRKKPLCQTPETIGDNAARSGHRRLFQITCRGDGCSLSDLDQSVSTRLRSESEKTEMGVLMPINPGRLALSGDLPIWTLSTTSIGAFPGSGAESESELPGGHAGCIGGVPFCSVPPNRNRKGGSKKRCTVQERPTPPVPTGHELPGVHLEPDTEPPGLPLWNEYSTSYHYLGHSPLPGASGPAKGSEGLAALLATRLDLKLATASSAVVTFGKESSRSSTTPVS